MSGQADMPKGISVIEASGALPLELPAEFQAVGSQSTMPWYTTGDAHLPMSPMPISPLPATPQWATSPGYPMSPASPGIPMTPRVRTTFRTAALPLLPRGSPVGMHSPMAARSPTNWSFGQAAMSPGAEIRRNAASFGIPLKLQSQPGEVVMPLPVRTASGAVLAPSPVGRGHLQPSQLTFTGMSMPMPQIMPAQQPSCVSAGGYPRDAASFAQVTPGAPAPISQIRGIVTPSRAGLRGGA